MVLAEDATWAIFGALHEQGKADKQNMDVKYELTLFPDAHVLLGRLSRYLIVTNL